MKNSTKIFLFVALPALIFGIAALLIIFNAFGVDVKSKARGGDDEQDIEKLVEDLKKYAKDRLDIEEVQDNIEQVKKDLSDKIDGMINDKISDFVTENDVNEAIADAITDIQPGLTEEDVKTLIDFDFVSTLTGPGIRNNNKFVTTTKSNQDIEDIVTHRFVEELRNNGQDADSKFATLSELTETMNQYATEDIVEDGGESFDYFTDN